MLLFYYMNINININLLKIKYDVLIFFRNNKRKIYNNILLYDVICKNRTINNINFIKKPYLFIKLYINDIEIDYNMKKLIFCHDENNTLNDVYKAYHYKKIDKIIVNNKNVDNNIQIKNLLIN